MILSAGNQLPGVVTKVDEGAVNAIVHLDIGNGNQVSAAISMASVRNLELTPGCDAIAVIKATSVMVGVEE